MTSDIMVGSVALVGVLQDCWHDRICQACKLKLKKKIGQELGHLLPYVRVDRVAGTSMSGAEQSFMTSRR